MQFFVSDLATHSHHTSDSKNLSSVVNDSFVCAKHISQISQKQTQEKCLPIDHVSDCEF